MNKKLDLLSRLIEKKMTSLENLNFTKTWILTKYSKFCGNVNEKENWKVRESLF